MRPSTCSLSVFMLFFICWKSVAQGNSDTPQCELTIHNNKTLFKRLLNYYDPDGQTIIVEHTLRFENASVNFNESRMWNADAFQPYVWYSTQGIGSPRLLLTYDFMFGLMEYILSFCIAKEVLNLNVNPPDCLEKFENKSLEDFLRKFMLKELNVGDRRVKDLYMCTAHFDVDKTYPRLIYRCCLLDHFGDYSCIDVEEDVMVERLNYCIIIITFFLLLTLPVVFPDDYRLELYEFTLPNELDAIISMSPDSVTMKIKDETLTVPFSCLKKMHNFKKIQAMGTNGCRLVKLLVEIPLSKIFWCNKNELGFFTILCQMMSECFTHCKGEKSHVGDDVRRSCSQTPQSSVNHGNGSQRQNCTTKMGLSWQTILKYLFIKMYVAVLSAPILISLFTDDTRSLEVKREFRKRVPDSQYDESFDADLTGTICIVVPFFLLYLDHVLMFFLCENKYREFYTYILNFHPKSQYAITKNWYNPCVVFIMWIQRNLPNVFSIALTLFLFFKNYLKLLKKPSKFFLALSIYVSSWAVILLTTCAIFFLVGIVVIVILLAVMEGGFVYNLIKIALLLAAYVYKSVKQVHEPFDNFMRSLLKTQLIKDLCIDRRAQKTTRNCSVLGQLEKPLFLVTDTDLWVKLNHPFIDVYEKKISQRFLFQCASVDHSEAPGTVLHNFSKAVKRIIFITLFIVFIYLVVMAYGHINYISPSNLSFTAFAAALVPIIIINFLAKGADRIESTDESKKLLQKKLKEKLKDFRESWIIHDLIVEEIPNGHENNSEANPSNAINERGNGTYERLLNELEIIGADETDDDVNEEIGIWRLAKEEDELFNVNDSGADKRVEEGSSGGSTHLV